MIWPGRWRKTSGNEDPLQLHVQRAYVDAILSRQGYIQGSVAAGSIDIAVDWQYYASAFFPYTLTKSPQGCN